MVRYILSFSVPEGKITDAQKIINRYFDELNKSGPGGMRSFCYCSEEESNSFVQINTYRKESVANKDLRSDYTYSFVTELKNICNQQLSFNKMETFDSFESIY
jgi:quinol monooxygenase YgiN